MTSVPKDDEAADAEKPVFEMQPVQGTAALSYAGQVETANEQPRLRTSPAGLAQQTEQSSLGCW